MEKAIPVGFCQCGCGKKTWIATGNYTKRGWVKGEPVKWISGHHGKKDKTKNGRPTRDVNGKSERIYRIEAERILGKPLPPKAVVHHHGPKEDQCIVICQNQSYHILIERRTRALRECGHADWLKCEFCKQYDDPSKMYVRATGNPRPLHFHRNCRNLHAREKRYARRKAAI